MVDLEGIIGSLDCVGFACVRLLIKESYQGSERLVGREDGHGYGSFGRFAHPP